MRLAALVVCTAVLVTAPVIAAPPIDLPPTPTATASGASFPPATDIFAPLPLIASAPGEPLPAPITATPEHAAFQQAVLDHEKWRLKHIERVFDQQYVCSGILFYVVIALVAVGVGMSLYQFLRVDPVSPAGSTSPKPGAAKPLVPPVTPREPSVAEETMAGDPPDAAPMSATVGKKEEEAATVTAVAPLPSAAVVHELSLDAKGLRVSSPALGIVILGLSLSFFFLYLKFVYPVSVVSTAPKENVAAEGAKN